MASARAVWSTITSQASPRCEEAPAVIADVVAVAVAVAVAVGGVRDVTTTLHVIAIAVAVVGMLARWRSTTT
jgi:hypothetical protein